MLKYDIKNQILTCVYADPVVTDSQGYLTASFKFTPDWADLLITTYWAKASEPNKNYKVLYKGSDVRVPDEVLTDINGFNLTIIGSNKLDQKNVLATTNVEHVPAIKSGLPIVDPENPTESIWGSGLAEALNKIETAPATRIDEAEKTAINNINAALGNIEISVNKAEQAADHAKQEADRINKNYSTTEELKVYINTTIDSILNAEEGVF